MKKYLFLLLVIFALPAYAESYYQLNLNVGNVGYGGNLPLVGNYRSEFILTLINVGIEHKKTNLGVEINPFKSYYWGDENEFSDLISFINLSLYWNIINHEFSDGVIYFGPYTSLNYLFLEGEKFNLDRYIFTVGTQIGFRMNIGGINYNLLSVETGYRRIDGQTRFFVGGKIDIITLFVSLLLFYNL